jgi:hypothetical protein
MSNRRLFTLLAALPLAVACANLAACSGAVPDTASSGDALGEADAGATDAALDGSRDAALDAAGDGASDAGANDAAGDDASDVDASATDSGASDAGDADTDGAAPSDAGAGDDAGHDSGTVDAGATLTWTTIYNEAFAKGTPGHCGNSGCHLTTKSGFLCGTTAASCLSGMIAKGLIDTTNPKASLLGDPANSPLIWIDSANGAMPADSSAANAKLAADITAWLSSGAAGD